jgi:hypothetical protein
METSSTAAELADATPHDKVIVFELYLVSNQENHVRCAVCRNLLSLQSRQGNATRVTGARGHRASPLRSSGSHGPRC